jgi:hypothetical protein
MSKYRNYLGYDKRDYHHPEKGSDTFCEEEIQDVYVEETTEWDDVSMEVLEFLQDEVVSMAVPLLDQRFGLFDIIQLISAHARKNT